MRQMAHHPLPIRHIRRKTLEALGSDVRLAGLQAPRSYSHKIANNTFSSRVCREFPDYSLEGFGWPARRTGLACRPNALRQRSDFERSRLDQSNEAHSCSRSQRRARLLTLQREVGDSSHGLDGKTAAAFCHLTRKAD